MYTDVKTEKGIVRVHHETTKVMFKPYNSKAWRWMQRTDDFVAHRHRKARAAGRAAKGLPKMRLVKK